MNELLGFACGLGFMFFATNRQTYAVRNEVLKACVSNVVVMLFQCLFTAAVVKNNLRFIVANIVGTTIGTGLSCFFMHRKTKA